MAWQKGFCLWMPDESRDGIEETIEGIEEFTRDFMEKGNKESIERHNLSRIVDLLQA